MTDQIPNSHEPVSYVDSESSSRGTQAYVSTTPTRRRQLGGNHMGVTGALIAINVVCYLISLLLPTRLWSSLALSQAALTPGHWYSFITSMFMHGSFSHLANNMMTLFFLGAQLERRLSRSTYITMYMASGVLAGVFFLLMGLVSGRNVAAVGASGAIFGLFGVYGFIILRNHLLYGRGDGSPRTEIQVGMFVILMIENIGYGLVTPGIANSAHIGGLLSGFLLAYLFVHPDLSGLLPVGVSYPISQTRRSQ